MYLTCTLFLLVLTLILDLLPIILTKIYEKCDLVKELEVKFKMPQNEIATWICIVNYESNFNTEAVNVKSGDHGLFQISQLYWCSPPGNGYGCNTECSKFRDDDISDDLKCIRRIFNEHKRISGNGFNAWTVYPQYCVGNNSKFIKECYLMENFHNNTADNEITEENEEEEEGDGYNFPLLSTFNNNKGKMARMLPFTDISIHKIIVEENPTKSPPVPFSKISINDYFTTKADEATTTAETDEKLIAESSSLLELTTVAAAGRQVTFSPDSFFSWIFGSQTLPPIIRPPGRPTRPQTPLRPPNNNLGGPPRPPRPQRRPQIMMGPSKELNSSDFLFTRTKFGFPLENINI